VGEPYWKEVFRQAKRYRELTRNIEEFCRSERAAGRTPLDLEKAANRMRQAAASNLSRARRLRDEYKALEAKYGPDV